MNRSKAKGTAWETSVVNWLIEHGWPYAERRALNGALDKGDISGLPGVVVECKDTKAADWAGQLNEAVLEAKNAKAAYGILVRKRYGKTDPGDAYFVMRAEDGFRLLKEAGY